MAVGRVTLSRLILAGIMVRLGLYGISKLQDAYMEVKFTDVDYSVFSGAAGQVWNGSSPYRQSTYRYTPLLAYALIPVVYWRDFGKFLFCLCDILAAALIYRLITRDVAYGHFSSARERSALIAVGLWLFNPLTAVVSTRGNAESLLAVMVLSTLYCLNDHNWLLAALLHGLAIHFKLFPLIYLPSALLFVTENCLADGDDLGGILAELSRLTKPFLNVTRLLRICINRAAILYLVVCGLIFMCFLRGFWGLYGYEFAYETYLYHFERVDTQHNFSPYFYPLRFANSLGLKQSQLGLVAFVPQAISTVVLSLWYYDDLGFCWFLTTAFFVTFNKVSTSQYFLWYLCLLPLCVGKVVLTVGEALKLFGLWLFAQGVWLGLAYLLEFQHLPVDFMVFLASVAFMLGNLHILHRLMCCYNVSSKKTN